MRPIAFILCISLLFQVSASAKKLAAPKEVLKDIAEVFKEKISYSDLKITAYPTPNNMSALKKVQNAKSQFAVVRADILYNVTRLHSQDTKLKDNYIVLSKLPYKAQLYLLQNKDTAEIYLDELKYKTVSIDVLGNNSLLLKQILKMYGVSLHVDYKALEINESLEEISSGKIDAFFGFLRKFKQHQFYNTQTIFSKKTIDYLKANPKGLEVGEYEIQVPYVLIAHKETSDEEIESIIYRLKKKKLFSPLTDTKYGMINLYIMQHLREIERIMEKELRSRIVAPGVALDGQVNARSAICKEYHYGFLRLLRRKPSIKKVLKKMKRVRPSHYKKGVLLLKDINKILIQIDAKSDRCNIQFLKDKKSEFLRVEKSVKNLLR